MIGINVSVSGSVSEPLIDKLKVDISMNYHSQ